MKLLLALLVVSITGLAYSQEPDTSSVQLQRTTINPEEIHSFPEEQAQFPGGTAALTTYLKEQLVYPAAALEKGIAGSCYIKFVIDEKGKTLNPTIMRGVPECPECNAEAIRLINAMPIWTPAKQGGKTVKSYYVLKINFKLPE